MIRKRAKRLAGAVLAAGAVTAMPISGICPEKPGICLFSRKMGDTPRQ